MSIGFDYKLNEQHKIAYFNVLVERNSFLFDFATNKKIILGDEKDYEICDISQDGELAITTSRTHERKNRKLRIVKIKTLEVMFETNAFFIYEALFTPVPNLIICRADIKKNSADKTFVYNIDTEEIIYIFPSAHCLEYGNVNFECNTFIFLGRKKGEIILFCFDKLEAITLKFRTNKMIHRVMQLDSSHLFFIDGNYFAMKINISNNTNADEAGVMWKTKLDFKDFSYAPNFFISSNKIIFGETAFENEVINERAGRSFSDTDPRYIFSIDLDSGNLETVKIVQGVIMGTIRKHFGDSVMDFVGTIFDMKKNELSEFGILEYTD